MVSVNFTNNYIKKSTFGIMNRSVTVSEEKDGKDQN